MHIKFAVTYYQIPEKVLLLLRQEKPKKNEQKCHKKNSSFMKQFAKTCDNKKLKNYSMANKNL